MAKLDMGILGGFSGRVGTVVGYHRRGAWFVRAYQPHIRDRKSAAQLEQRSRFKAMIQFASPATPVLRIGLKHLAADQQITEGNAFLKINKNHFRSSPKLGEVAARSADGGVCPANPDTHAPVAACGGATPSSLEGELRIDYSSLQFSQGSLPGVRSLQWSVDEDGALRVRWERGGGVRGDRVHIYVYCRGCGLVAEGRRGDGHVQLLLPEGFTPDGMHVWAFAANGQGEVSKTVYGGLAEELGQEVTFVAGGVGPAGGVDGNFEQLGGALAEELGAVGGGGHEYALPGMHGD